MNLPQPTIFECTPVVPEPTLDDAARVSLWLRDQPPFLVENMKALVASAKKSVMQCIRVTKTSGATVANIASETVLLRTIIPDNIAAGAYILAKEVSKSPPRSHWSGYPDVDLVQPDFQELGTLNPVMADKSVCGAFVTWCQAVRGAMGQVVITKDCAYMRQNNTHRFPFPFGLADDAIVHPEHLIHAFKEAQRYEAVYITRQRSTERNMPLVIGFNWNSCILVSTQSSHAYYQEKTDSW
jgi:hypothetical protein